MPLPSQPVVSLDQFDVELPGMDGAELSADELYDRIVGD